MVDFRTASMGTGIQIDSVVEAPYVITVGPGGEYSNLNDAIKRASKLWPDYVNKGLTVEIRQLSGFVMAEQVFMVQKDLSFITITSIDSQVTIQRSAITQNNGNSSGNNWRTGTFPAFCVMRGGISPFIRTLYAFDSSGTGVGTVGVYVFENASANIFRGCGVKNAGWRGLYVDGGFCYARETIWDGAGFAGGPENSANGGIRGSNGSVLMIRQASAQNCASGAYISDSMANVSDANFSGAGIGSTTSQGIGISANANAYVYGGGIIANNCERYGFHATNGGKLVAAESSTNDGVYSSATNCGLSAIYVDSGGQLVGERGTFTAAGNAVEVSYGSVNLYAATITSSGARGINATLGADVNAVNATVSGSTLGARADHGSRVNFTNAKIQGGTRSLDLSKGSIAHMGSATLLDGVTPATTNVTAGTFNANGIVLGV